eukprot:gene17517-biopygen15912
MEPFGSERGYTRRQRGYTRCQPDGLTGEGTQHTICGHPRVPSITPFAIDGVSMRPQNSFEPSIWRTLWLSRFFVRSIKHGQIYARAGWLVRRVVSQERERERVQLTL